jgi:hypothetical protein
MFRATEAGFGELPEYEIERILPDASNWKRKKVVKALRDARATLGKHWMPRQGGRQRACFKRGPRYIREWFGMLASCRGSTNKLPITKRDPREVVVEVSAAEGAVHSAMEGFGDTFKAPRRRIDPRLAS